MPRILDECPTVDHAPTDREVEDYAEWLGMNVKEDADLLWIARQGLKTPLAKPWKACESGRGELFYFNPDSGESRWDHPCDEELQCLYAAEKAKKQAAALVAANEAAARKTGGTSLGCSSSSGDGAATDAQQSHSDTEPVSSAGPNSPNKEEQRESAPDLAAAPEPIATPLPSLQALASEDPPPLPPLGPPPILMPVPAAQNEAEDSTSSPTPPLAAILAAELRPEDSKEQLSLWSQLEEGAKADQCRPAAATPVSVGKQKAPEDLLDSLEISSLTAVMERSPEVGACDDAQGMVEQLQRMQAETTKRDLGCQLAASMPATDSWRSPSHAVPVADEASTAVQLQQETGPFGSTIKLHSCWSQGREAQLRDEACTHQLEQFQEELCALAARVEVVEHGKVPSASTTTPATGVHPTPLVGVVNLESSSTESSSSSSGDSSATGTLARVPQVIRKDLEVMPVPIDRRQEDPRLEQLSCEVRHLRSAVAETEWSLQETRLSLQREQASLVSAQAANRESQSEVLRLKKLLKHKDAEVERMRVEMQRCQTELASRDDENHQLQLQLSSRDAEIGQMRLQITSQMRQGDYALQHQRQEQRDTELKLNARQRIMDDREQLLGELELRLQRQQRELRSDQQRAELGTLRATLSEAALCGRQRTSAPSTPLTPEGGDTTALVQPTSRPPDGGYRRARPGRHMSSAKRNCSSDHCGNAMPPTAVRINSEVETFSSPDLQRAPPPSSDGSSTQHSAQVPEVRCLFETPSSASSTVSVREAKEASNDVGKGIPSAAAQERLVGPTFFNARSMKEMSSMLQARRRELRTEHAELEERRQAWRNEMRQARRGTPGSTPTASPESLGEVRSALDAKSATLNRAIGEYRALEQFLVSQQRRHCCHAAAGSDRRASSSGTLRRAGGVHSSSSGPLTCPSRCSEGDHASQRWQQLVGKQRDTPGEPADSGCNGGCSAAGCSTVAEFIAPCSDHLKSEHAPQVGSCGGCSSRRLQAISCPASPARHRAHVGGA
mmetsp:Transcript_94934/g.188008  ORF Transcript_94934/g.188008 Transcript_94934/m.188008 type:complete len:1014 (+) Transcript_94934:60-3101(+)